MHIKEEKSGYYMEKIRKNGPLISVHHPKLAMVSMLLGAFVGMFSETSLNIALPTLVQALQVNTGTIQWLVTGYMLVIGIVLPLSSLINRWFTINLFDWLSSWGLSMGIVILLMTIIVKILVLPTTWKSFISSAKMRALKPYVDKINAKYPKQEDALKKQQETMALYSQYGVSPMGGCLPMLIQTPVFMALFFFVPNAIELRQQSFLWASDLSAYDDLISWSTHIPLLGNHLSLFCLLFSVTTVLNQIIMMKQQDMGNNPQMAAMKWMMYIMPVMFFFIFNEYASGLSYYYFISGLIGIITMWIMRRMTDEKKLLAQLEANKKAPSERKTSGLMAKLEAKRARTSSERTSGTYE